MNFHKSLRKLCCMRGGSDSQSGYSVIPAPVEKNASAQIIPKPMRYVPVSQPIQTIRRIPVFPGSMRDAASRSDSRASSSGTHHLESSAASDISDAVNVAGFTSVLGWTFHSHFPLFMAEELVILDSTTAKQQQQASHTTNATSISRQSSADSFHTAASSTSWKPEPPNLKRMARHRNLRQSRESDSP